MEQRTQWKKLKEDSVQQKKGEPRFKYFEGNYLCLRIFATAIPPKSHFSDRMTCLQLLIVINKGCEGLGKNFYLDNKERTVKASLYINKSTQ